MRVPTLGLPRWMGGAAAFACAGVFYFAVPPPHRPGFRADSFSFAVRWDGAAWRVECPRASDDAGTADRPALLGNVQIHSTIKKSGRRAPVLWEDLTATVAVESAYPTMNPEQVTATMDGVAGSLADSVGSLRPGGRAAVLHAPRASGRLLWANLCHLAACVVIIAVVYGFVAGGSSGD